MYSYEGLYIKNILLLFLVTKIAIEYKVEVEEYKMSTWSTTHCGAIFFLRGCHETLSRGEQIRHKIRGHKYDNIGHISKITGHLIYTMIQPSKGGYMQFRSRASTRSYLNKKRMTCICHCQVGYLYIYYIFILLYNSM